MKCVEFLKKQSKFQMVSLGSCYAPMLINPPQESKNFYQENIFTAQHHGNDKA